MPDEILLIFTNKQKPLIDDYLESVVRGGLRRYQTATQRGIRTGQDLYSHLTRGGLLLYSLGSGSLRAYPNRPDCRYVI